MKPRKLLFCLLLLIVISNNTKAQEFETGGIKYNITNTTDKTVEIISKEPAYSGDLVIPSTVEYSSENYSVTALRDMAFYGCNDLTSVNIPNSILSFGNYTFYNCKSLTSITIPNSVEHIGNGCFMGCEGVTSFTIPNSVTNIGDNAFNYCNALTSYIVGTENNSFSSQDGVLLNKGGTTLIQYPAGKKGSYTIHNSVTNIGKSAFEDCDSLTLVNIPSTVTNIGYRAFAHCEKLASITVDTKNENYSSIEGILFNKEKTTLIQFTGYNKSHYTIPGSVTSIGDFSFYGCHDLISVNIPNSVTNINYHAFCDCTALTSIYIPNSVTNIGSLAFCGCIALTSVTIPNSITSIEEFAFQYCTKLTSLVCKITTPLNVDDDFIFDNVDTEKCTLWVPSASLNDYETANVWKDFNPIKVIIEPSNLSLNKNNLTLTKNTEESLTATLTPENITDKTVIWNSSNKEVATVDNTGKVTAIKEGTASITATHIDGEYSASCNVTIQDENSTGIENSVSIKTNLYPNPTTGKVYYKIKDVHVHNLAVTDISGKIIFTTSEINKTGFIDLSGKEDGIYFINLYTPNNIISKKIVKNSHKN